MLGRILGHSRALTSEAKKSKWRNELRLLSLTRKARQVSCSLTQPLARGYRACHHKDCDASRPAHFGAKTLLLRPISLLPPTSAIPPHRIHTELRSQKVHH